MHPTTISIPNTYTEKTVKPRLNVPSSEDARLMNSKTIITSEQSRSLKPAQGQLQTTEKPLVAAKVPLGLFIIANDGTLIYTKTVLLTCRL